LADRFRPSFKEVQRGGSFADIIRGKDYGVMEVPSWAWHRKLGETQEYLSKQVDAIDPFVWPFLRDNLGVCHCLFSKAAVSITPVLVDLLPTFEECGRRIYMSATIADDSEIVRTFDAAGGGGEAAHIDFARRGRRADDPGARPDETWRRRDHAHP
jgi:hypothetical protein